MIAVSHGLNCKFSLSLLRLTFELISIVWLAIRISLGGSAPRRGGIDRTPGMQLKLCTPFSIRWFSCVFVVCCGNLFGKLPISVDEVCVLSGCFVAPAGRKSQSRSDCPAQVPVEVGFRYQAAAGLIQRESTSGKKKQNSSLDQKRRHIPLWRRGRRAYYVIPDLSYCWEGGRE